MNHTIPDGLWCCVRILCVAFWQGNTDTISITSEKKYYDWLRLVYSIYHRGTHGMHDMHDIMVADGLVPNTRTLQSLINYAREMLPDFLSYRRVRLLTAIPLNGSPHSAVISWRTSSTSNQNQYDITCCPQCRQVITVINMHDIDRLCNICRLLSSAWWRHQMETFFALLAICAGNSPVPGEFPTQRTVTRSFGVFFDLHPNKRWWDWWLETPSCPLWRHHKALNAEEWHQV